MLVAKVVLLFALFYWAYSFEERVWFQIGGRQRGEWAKGVSKSSVISESIVTEHPDFRCQTHQISFMNSTPDEVEITFSVPPPSVSRGHASV